MRPGQRGQQGGAISRVRRACVRPGRWGAARRSGNAEAPCARGAGWGPGAARARGPRRGGPATAFPAPGRVASRRVASCRDKTHRVASRRDATRHGFALPPFGATALLCRTDGRRGDDRRSRSRDRHVIGQNATPKWRSNPPVIQKFVWFVVRPVRRSSGSSFVWFVVRLVRRSSGSSPGTSKIFLGAIAPKKILILFSGSAETWPKTSEKRPESV